MRDQLAVGSSVAVVVSVSLTFCSPSGSDGAFSPGLTVLSSTCTAVIPLPCVEIFGLSLVLDVAPDCWWSPVGSLISCTVAFDGGVNSKVELATGPNETSLAASSMTGAELLDE